tara:strand:- start:379 stop:531 length:153 start_codon:yes stop_codon:yes gene_type:complete
MIKQKNKNIIVVKGSDMEVKIEYRKSPKIDMQIDSTIEVIKLEKIIYFFV